MKYKILVIAVSTMFISGLTAQEVWTLEKCINHAWNSNLQIKKATNLLYSAEVDHTQSKMAFLPSVNGSFYSYSNSGFGVDNTSNELIREPFSTLTPSINANISLFESGRRLVDMKMKKESVLLSNELIHKSKNDIALEITRMFLAILLSKEQLANANSQLSTTTLRLANTEKLVKAGQLSQGEEYTLLAQVANDEFSLVNAKINFQQAYLSLKILLDLDRNIEFEIAAPDSITLPDSRSAEDLNNIFNIAKKTLPDLIAEQMKSNIANFALKSAHSSRFPTISASGSISANGSSLAPLPFETQLRNNRSEYITFNLSIPLFNKYQVTKAIKQASINLENSKIDVAIAEKDLYNQINVAFYDMKAAYSKYKAALKQENASKEAFRYASKKHDAGMINTLEFTQAKDLFNVAQSELVIAKYEYLFKSKTLDFYEGKKFSFDN